ncbi:hypothetical protein CHELA1G11_10138 [Hyphomicrobiales bacterium]|nr:hypothetical protein CHELA1G11_10138 [Hyphomicrobiales bacterium]
MNLRSSRSCVSVGFWPMGIHPDNARRPLSSVAETMWSGAVEPEAIALLEMVLDALDLDDDLPFEYEAAFLSVMRIHLRTGRPARLQRDQEDLQARRAAAWRQQLLGDARSPETELLPLVRFNHDPIGRMRHGRQGLVEQIAETDVQGVRDAGQNPERWRRHPALDLAELPDRYSRGLRDLLEGHLLDMPSVTDTIPQQRIQLRQGLRLPHIVVGMLLFHPRSPNLTLESIRVIAIAPL